MFGNFFLHKGLFFIIFLVNILYPSKKGKQMKKIMIASMLVTAAMFTACEVSEDVTSCDVSLNLGALGSMHSCIESTNDAAVRQECKEINDDMAYLGLSNVGVVGSGCTGGARKTCSDTMEDGSSYTAYFYDKDADGQTCDQLLSDDDDYEDDYGF